MALEDFDTQETSASQVGKPAPRPVPAKPAVVAKPVVAAAAAPAPAPAPKAQNSDDEDLFDFPVVEMKLEASAPVAAPAPAPAAKKPAPPAPVKPVVPVAAPAPAPAKEPVAAPVQEKKDIAQAAQIVEDLEEVLGAGVEPVAPSRPRKLPSPLALAGVAALVLTNVLGLFFLWRTAQTYQNGVQAMNEKLAETLRRQGEAQSLALAADAQHKTSEPPRPAAGLETFELSTLQVAREEIQAGAYSDARRRLARLLAVADRIDAASREDVEAQAAFLIASTYRKQAEAAREKSP
jgi:hypothetical protein